MSRHKYIDQYKWSSWAGYTANTQDFAQISNIYRRCGFLFSPIKLAAFFIFGIFVNLSVTKPDFMKKFLLPYLAGAMCLICAPALSQVDTTNKLGLAGDGLDLYAVLDVF